MSESDKVKNAAEKTGGKVKETLGDATDNERMENEGRAEQSKADIKQAGEKVKDAFKN